MSTPWWQLDWVWQATGWTLVAAGLVLFLWALFWDRARGRRRCPKCWYDLSGAVLEAAEKKGRDREETTSQDAAFCVCPECGKKITGLSQLGRTRRHWRRAVVACLVVCFGLQTSQSGTPGREGVYAYLPTVAMLAIAPDFQAGSSSPVAVALVARLQHGSVLPWDRHIASWVELQRVSRWSNFALHRQKWPVGIPVRVNLIVDDGARSCFEFRNTTLQWLDGETTDAQWSANPPQVHVFQTQRPRDYLELPAPVLGANAYRLRATVRGQHGISRSGEFSITVEGVPTIDDVLVPVVDDASTQEVRSDLTWSVYADGGTAGVWVSLRSGRTLSRAKDTTYLLRCELIRDGQVVDSGDPPLEWWRSIRLPLVRDIAKEDAEQTALALDGLMLRVTGNPAAALNDLNRSKYWNGEITMPLRSVTWAFENAGGITFLLDTSRVDTMPYASSEQASLVSKLTKRK